LGSRGKTLRRWRRVLPTRAIALAFPLLGLERSARADGAGEPEEVVVIGSAASSGFVSKASVDEAPREITDASSLVESVPGVHVRRLGGDDSFATLSIRGSTSSEVAILFAGVPMTGAADPSLDLATLPLWPGARIRIYRSFAPAAFGPGSLGGTLVLEPPRTTDPERTETWGAIGSFGEARMRIADVRAVSGGGRVVTALSASRADDDFSFLDATPLSSCGTSTSPPSSCYVTRRNNGHAAVNGLVAWAIPFGKDGTLSVTTLLQDRRQELPGGISNPSPDASLTSNRELSSLELSQPVGTGAFSARVWGRRDELALENRPTLTNETIPSRSDDVIDAAGVSAGWRGRAWRALLLEARADGSVEGNEPGVTVGGAGATPQATRVSAGAGLDADWRVSSPWKLGASGRLDVDSDSVPSPASSGVPTPGSAESEFRPTGHLGTEVELGPVVFATHGGAVARPASFVELYGSPGGILPNPSLVGESAWTVDAGARAQSPRAPIRVQAEVALFATWARNLILFVPEGEAGYLQAENIGRARIYGLEASVRAKGYGFDLQVSYTGLVSENEDVEAAGAPLPGRPANDFVGDLGYSIGPVRVRYGIDAVTGIYQDNVGKIPVPDRVLQGVGARVDVPGVRGLRLAFEIRNLFDVRTGTYPGFVGPETLPIGDQYNYPLPGRSFLVTARWTAAPPMPGGYPPDP
jgi:vitamin B12 transporter